MKKNILILVGVVAVVGIAAYFAMHKAPASPDTTPSPSASPVKSTNFNNKYMSVDVAAGWKAAAVGNAVNITKGNWVLYINPAAVQVGGALGGRFDEYAAGAPGVELVMGDLERPRSGRECATPSVEQGAVNIEGTSVARYDYFTVVKGAMPGCHIPDDAPSAWLLSVVGNVNGFNEVKSVTQKKVLPAPNDFPARLFAITMSYKATTVGELPRQYSKDLVNSLREMDAIVSTLVFN